eukprot:378254-Lingulodinium_polyedra.AAC.1
MVVRDVVEPFPACIVRVQGELQAAEGRAQRNFAHVARAKESLAAAERRAQARRRALVLLAR